jgi:hypothetical protein
LPRFEDPALWIHEGDALAAELEPHEGIVDDIITRVDLAMSLALIIIPDPPALSGEHSSDGQDAMGRQIPIIYFLGTSPGQVQPIIPTFIVGWHPERLWVQLAFGVIVGTSA